MLPSGARLSRMLSRRRLRKPWRIALLKSRSEVEGLVVSVAVDMEKHLDGGLIDLS